MKIYKMWKDYESESINEKDLLNFALDLWKSGQIRVTSHWDEEIQKTMTRYSIVVSEDV